VDAAAELDDDLVPVEVELMHAKELLAGRSAPE
jgi:hypothetical protein